MNTLRLTVDPLQPTAEGLAPAVETLRRGGLVAFPTETVYGLGANALSEAAVQGIFAAKGRPATNPLIVHVSGVEGARRLTTAWPEDAQRLAEAFWPGPLTIVLPRAACIPSVVAAGGSTVAVRCPAHPVARALLAAVALPLAAPSANRSNYISPTRAEHVLASLDGRIDMVLDGGVCPGGVESTVIDLSRTAPSVLRYGLVAPSQLEAVLGRPVGRPVGRPGDAADHGVEATAPQAEVLRSPGQLARHYAPRATLEWASAADHARRRWETALAAGEKAVLVELGAEGLAASGAESVLAAAAAAEGKGLVAPLPSDPARFAACWYDVLYALDALGVQRIVVPPLPEGEAWLPLHDRLRRGSHSAE